MDQGRPRRLGSKHMGWGTSESAAPSLGPPRTRVEQGLTFQLQGAREPPGQVFKGALPGTALHGLLSLVGGGPGNLPFYPAPRKGSASGDRGDHHLPGPLPILRTHDFLNLVCGIKEAGPYLD